MVDGTSKTFAVGEVIGADENDSDNVWSTAARLVSSMRSTQYALNTPHKLPFAFMSPNYGTVSSHGFGSHHPGGGNFLYVDGHVTFISDNIAINPYRATSTYRGTADGTDLASPVQ